MAGVFASGVSELPAVGTPLLSSVRSRVVKPAQEESSCETRRKDNTDVRACLFNQGTFAPFYQTERPLFHNFILESLRG